MSSLPYRRILITGGAGFIGSHLAERFCQAAEVVLLDNYRRDSLAHIPELRDHPNVRVIQADVRQPDTLAPAMEGVDAVLHLAAIAGVSSYYSEPLNTLRVNIEGTINVLQAATDAGVERLVYFSTSEVFGPRADRVTEESHSTIGPLSDPRWTYGISKMAGEQFVLRWGQGIAGTIVRPFNVYGPRQTGEGAIGNFCTAAISGEPLLIYGDGKATRAWCYVSDMVDAVEAILRTPESAGEAFNIGNPHAVETTLGLAQRIMRLSPGSSLEYREVHRQEVLDRTPVISKSRRILGFTPRVGLDEGLAATLAWFRSRKGAA